MVNRRNNIPRKNPDEENKKLNIGRAMYGFANPDFRDEEDMRDDSNDYTSAIFGDGWEDKQAPSTNRGETTLRGARRPNRPRALTIGYNRSVNLLVIAFREPTQVDKETKQVRIVGKSPWIVYEDVDLEMWDELCAYHSTGEWLKYSGVETHAYYPVPNNDQAGLKKIVDSLQA